MTLGKFAMPAPLAEEVILRLSKKEALVFFEFLSRFSEDKSLAIEDPAEERVLWNLCCDLEKRLSEPLSPQYAELLADARRFIRDEKNA
jgi:hypothetical protein